MLYKLSFHLNNLFQTFSESTPLANDNCSTTQQLDISIANTPITVSGTTEDFMEKTLATDVHNTEDCVAEGAWIPYIVSTLLNVP